ncbi:PQQ-dependent sugar dehydrogenase [Actinomycetes bacterium KLBMP 9797]
MLALLQRSTFGRRRLMVAGLIAALGISLPASTPPRSAVAADTCFTATGKPIADPLPGKLKPGKLGVSLTDFITLPVTRPARIGPPSVPPVAPGQARINYIGEIPDGSGRLYVPDLNGMLYLVVNGRRVDYLHVARQFRDFQFAPGLGTGFGFVAFHPEFKTNRKFYTVHSEAGWALANKKPTLPPSPNTNLQHSIITEWTAKQSAANRFTGTKREVLRIGLSAYKHAIQQIGFNPYAKKGSGGDHGLLYIALGDGEEDNYLAPEWTSAAQNLGKPHGKILRINPLASGKARYTVPKDNPFAGQPGKLGEIYAYGLRDPHRFSWDPAAPHRMYLGAFGERRVEAVYEVRKGDNFGWNHREAIFAFRGKKRDQFEVFPLPSGDAKCGFTYPVATYGRDVNKGLLDDDGQPMNVVGISGGFVYRGKKIPELRGMYVFGDVVSGHVIYADASKMTAAKPGVVPPQPQLQLLRLSYKKKPVTISKLANGVDNRRSDFRLGIDGSGELYFLVKSNGKIWKVEKEGS